MASRIVTRPIAQKAKPKKSSDYLAFIRLLPCVVTGRWPVEAAHLSTASEEWGHKGRGKAQKASDRWSLPLHSDAHRVQHSGPEMAFWHEAGIDPHRLACIIWGMWCERGDDCLTDAIGICRSARSIASMNPERKSK